MAASSDKHIDALPLSTTTSSALFDLSLGRHPRWAHHHELGPDFPAAYAGRTCFSQPRILKDNFAEYFMGKTRLCTVIFVTSDVSVS